MPSGIFLRILKNNHSSMATQRNGVLGKVRFLLGGGGGGPGYFRIFLRKKS